METFRFFFFFFYRNLSGIANEIDGNHSFLFSGWKYNSVTSSDFGDFCKYLSLVKKMMLVLAHTFTNALSCSFSISHNQFFPENLQSPCSNHCCGYHL